MKVGLVLEGGAFRTIFSTGVWDAFLEHDIMLDYVVGVSAGIAYGVSYLSRQPRRNLDILVRYANDKRYMGMRNLVNPKNRCYWGLDFAYNTIPNELIPFDYDAFAAYPGQVEAVVTNLETGQAEYFPVPRGRDGNFKLLQATCALPLLFPVYHIDGKPVMDGGAADAIPFRRAFEQGCDRVVVCLTHERGYTRRPEKLEAAIDKRYGRKYPKFCQVMHKRAEVYNADRAELFELERQGKALVFAPLTTEGFSRMERDVTKIRTMWEDGHHQGEQRVEEVRAFLRG